MYQRALIFFCLLSAVCAPPARALETAAKQAFMIDMATHAVLLDKEGGAPMHPSSMSKLMTAYVLFSRLAEGRVALDSAFTVSEKAWRTQGSKTFVGIGSEITVEELIKGIIVQSGNDACIVVAEGISGTEEAFAAEMNRAAAQMGLQHSRFTNATGLPDDNHRMSARDLAVLSERLIVDFPQYYPYFALREHRFNNITQPNRNRLLGRTGVDGLKTGHTEAAGYGIALSAQQQDRRLILVLNGMSSDNERVEEGEKLLRWGFREFENKTLFRRGQKIAEAAVWFGKQPAVPLVASRDVVLTLPFAGGGKGVRLTIAYKEPLPAPVEKGAHVADVTVSAPGHAPQTVPLLAGEEVARLSGFGHLRAVIGHYLR